MNAILKEDAPTVRHVKPGDIIRIEDEEKRGKLEKYKVVKVYPYMVLALRGRIRRCFCYGDLLRMGMERQEPVKEALRKGTWGDW